jgi:hypothetical protein
MDKDAGRIDRPDHDQIQLIENSPRQPAILTLWRDPMVSLAPSGFSFVMVYTLQLDTYSLCAEYEKYLNFNTDPLYVGHHTK